MTGIKKMIPGPFVPITRPKRKTTLRWYSRTILTLRNTRNSTRTTATTAPMMAPVTSPKTLYLATRLTDGRESADAPPGRRGPPPGPCRVRRLGRRRRLAAVRIRFRARQQPVRVDRPDRVQRVQARPAAGEAGRDRG